MLGCCKLVNIKCCFMVNYLLLEVVSLQTEDSDGFSTSTIKVTNGEKRRALRTELLFNPTLSQSSNFGVIWLQIKMILFTVSVLWELMSTARFTAGSSRQARNYYHHTDHPVLALFSHHFLKSIFTLVEANAQRARRQTCQGCCTLVSLCISTSTPLYHLSINISAICNLFMIHTWVADASQRGGRKLKVWKRSAFSFCAELCFWEVFGKQKTEKHEVKLSFMYSWVCSHSWLHVGTQWIAV